MSEQLAFIRKKGGGGKYTETSLWTNPSPSNSFAAQTVTLSEGMSNFKYLAIKYKSHYSQADTNAVRCVVSVEDVAKLGNTVTYDPVLRLGGAYSNTNYTRYFKKGSDTTIVFGDSVQTNGTNTSNNYGIPLEILGLNELAQGTVQCISGTFTCSGSAVTDVTVTTGFRPKYIAICFNGASGSMSGSTAANGSIRYIYDSSVNTSYGFKALLNSNGSAVVNMGAIDSIDNSISAITDTGFVWRKASATAYNGTYSYFAIGEVSS